MRITPSLPAAHISQSFHPKQLPPSSHDSLQPARTTDRQTRFPLAHWEHGNLHIFATFDLQEGVTAQVYHKEKPLKIATHLHLQRPITRATLHQAQQTLSQSSLNVKYKGDILHLTPRLRLQGGMSRSAWEEKSRAQDEPAHHHLMLACIHAFEEGPKRPQDSAELAELARSSDREVIRAVLAAFLKSLQEKTLLDPMLLHGLARALEYADPKHLSHVDLVAILDYLKERIAKLSSADTTRIEELTALSALLDAMVAADVSGLDRKRIHKAVMQTVSSFTKDKNKEVACLAESCTQALVRLPSDESKLHAALRRALHAGEGLSLLAHAWNDKSLGSAVGAFQEFYKAFKPGKGKESWYESVQFAKLLIRQGHYAQAKEIVDTIPKEYTYLISSCVHTLPRKEQSQAKRHLALPPCAFFPLPQAGSALMQTARTTLSWRLHTLKETRLKIAEEEKLYIPLDGRKHPHSQERLDLLKEAHTFLDSNQKVLLIQGGSGAGKTLFLRTLERECWQDKEILPLHIRLGRIDPQSPHIVEEALSSLGLTERQIAALKTRRLVVFLDGYDEMAQGQLVNLYEHGGIKEWNAQVVISCRSQHIANIDRWERYFAPFKGETPDLKMLHTLYVVPFSEEQVHSYLDKYLTENPTPEWTTERFIETISQIKGLKDLIEAPFILRITAEVLPTILEEGLPESLTRRTLYDAFSTLWFKRQEAKLRTSGQEVPPDFQEQCLTYCQNLAMAMVEAHIVEAPYDSLELFSEGPSQWEKFFGPDAALLRTAAPLTKSETGYAFFHKSLLEHFASKATAAQIASLSHPKRELVRKQSKKERAERPQAKRYTTFEITTTRDLAKKWQEELSEQEQETLYNLAVTTIEAFSSHPLTEETIEEMIPLAAIPHPDLIRRLLEQLIHPLDKDVLIDLRLIRALSRAVALIDTAHVTSDHLTTCVAVLGKRLASLHKTKGEEALVAHLHALEQLTAALLDSSVIADDAQVKRLLESLKKIPTKNLQVQAACDTLKQALLRLNTNEDRLSDWLQRGHYIALGISALIESAGSYSPKKAVEGFLAFKEAVKTKGRQERWYEELRTAQLVIEGDNITAYQEMQLHPKEPHIQLTLIAALDRGVRTTTDEMVRSAWVQEIVSLGAQNPKIAGYVKSIIESYHIYDAPEVQRACIFADFQDVEAVTWVTTHLTPSYVHNALLATGKTTLSWRLAQLKAAALNDSTLLQEISYHVPLNAAYDASSSEHFPLDQGVQEFLSSDKRVLLLLGGSGSGKTLSMKLLAAHLWREHAQEKPIPLFISLTGIARMTTTLIEDALRKMGFTENQIKKLKENREFIFILDGYDEMSGEEVKNLLTTNNLLSWNGKVVFTCRTQYALQVGSYTTLFMPYDSEGRVQTSLYQEITTVPFASDQIERYLKQFCAQTDVSWTPDMYLNYIKRLPKVQEMIETPFVLRILTEVLPGIVAKHGAADLESLRLTRADFYEAFVRDWFDRQLDKLIRGGWGTLSPSEVKGYYAYAVKLATQMHTADLSEVRYHPSQNNNPFAPFFANDLPQLVRARTACPLIISREEGEVIYRFLHKSVLEFLGSRSTFDEEMLSAEGLAEVITAAQEVKDEPPHDAESITAVEDESLYDLGRIIASPLNHRLFTKEMGTLRFWVDDAQQNPSFRDQLLAIIELSKVHPEVKIAAANAMTILVGAEHSFSNADLSGIRVPGALLDRGYFSNANFEDADLKGCSFREAFFAGANCQGAHLEETDWGQQLILEGHTRSVRAVAYSPDGSQIASGSLDKTVRIWDAVNGATLLTFKGHTDKVTSIAYSPDGKRIASGSIDKTVRVWDAVKGTALLTLEGNRWRVHAVAYSPDGKSIAVGDEGGAVRVWDAGEGTALLTLKGNVWRVNAVAYSPDGKSIAVGDDGGAVRVWDAVEGTALLTLKEDEGNVTAVAYSPDGKNIVSGGSYDKTVRVWDASNGATLLTHKGHKGSVFAVAYSPDGTNIASGSLDKTVRVWDASNGATLLTLNGHKGDVTAVAYSPDGTNIASGSLDKTVRVWSSEEKIFLAPYPPEHTDVVTAVAYSPDGNFIASGSHDKTVRIWDARNGAALLTLEGHTWDVRAIAYSPDGKNIVSGGFNGMVCIWDAANGSVLLTFRDQPPVSAIAYSPDGKNIALGGPGETVRVLDAVNGAVFLTLEGHSRGVGAIAYSPDGNFIALGTNDHTVHVWNALNSKKLLTLYEHTDVVTAVAYSPDGNFIASGSHDRTIRVWNARNGSNILTIMDLTINRRDRVKAIAYSPDGKRIASGSYDKTVRVWNAFNGKKLLTLKGHTDSVTVVAYSPDGNFIASGSRDHKVRVWEISANGKSGFLMWCSDRTPSVEGMNIGGAYLEQKDQRLLQQLGAADSPSRCHIS